VRHVTPTALWLTIVAMGVITYGLRLTIALGMATLWIVQAIR
jgi:hypothetical protein